MMRCNTRLVGISCGKRELQYNDIVQRLMFQYGLASTMSSPNCVCALDLPESQLQNKYSVS